MDESKEHVPVPTLTWRRGWRIQASPLHARAWEGTTWGFRTLEKPGDLSSCNPAAGWVLHVGLSSDAPPETEMLSCGFRLRSPRAAPGDWVTVAAVASDVLVGESHSPISPSITGADVEARAADGSSWVDDLEEPALLVVRKEPDRTRFCFIAGQRTRHDAMVLANRLLEQEHDHLWELFLDRRRAFWERQDPLAGGRGLLTYAVESLHAYLMPGQGIMGDLWSASALPREASFDLRHLFPLVVAWREIDGAVARALLETAVGMIADDGSLPASILPNGAQETDHAALPLVCQSLRALWDVDRDRDIVYRLLPKVERYLRWILRHMDPDQEGRPCWQHAGEAWIRDTYDAGLASADLATMLLGEIDAFHELADTLPSGVIELQRFDSDYRSLADHLRSFLWDEESRNFRDRYKDGRRIARVTLSSVLPVGWPRLPAAQRESLMTQVRNTHFFMTQRGLALWVRWDTDQDPPPVPVLHQAILLDALSRVRLRDDEARLRLALADRLTADFRAAGRLFDDPPGGADDDAGALIPFMPEPLAAALAVIVWATPRPRALDPRHFPKTLAWMDKHRKALLVTAAVLATGMVLGGVSYVLLKRSLNVQGAETAVGLARRLYAEENYDEALRILRQMEETSGDRYAIEQLIGNVYFRKGLFAEAEVYFRRSIERVEENPQAAMNLALALFRQGRWAEARTEYERVAAKYEFLYPDIANRATAALEILDEKDRMRPRQDDEPGGGKE